MVSYNKKKATKSKVKTDKIAELNEKIISMIERGVTPWKICWNKNKNGGSFSNPISGVVYKGINPILCLIDKLDKGYESNYFCSFLQAKNNGWAVVKGSKATGIRFSKKIEKEGEDEEKKDTFFISTFTNVFNFDCIDDSKSDIKKSKYDKELTLPLFENTEEKVEALELFTANTKAKVETLGDQPRYNYGKDIIYMPEFSSFRDAESYYSTLLHELAHWTGNSDRLDRKFKANETRAEYAYEELIAELASVYLCNHNQIDTDLENHASYLDSWLKLLKSDSKCFIKACTEASKVYEYLVNLQ